MTCYCTIRILKSEPAERAGSDAGSSTLEFSRGFALDIQPAEQHSWLGVVERKHQVARRALELYQDDLGRHDPAAPKEAAIYVPHTINQILEDNHQKERAMKQC